MAIDLQAQWFRGLAELRYASTPKRLRALLDGRTVLDTKDALLVYEPRRIVPWYAVPPGDLHLELTEHDQAPVPQLRTPVLPPRHNEWHTVPGRSLHLDGHREVAFRPDDPDLGGRLVMHWEPFTWLEEDEPVMGHPHDPFKRIDVLRSNRHVRVRVGGVNVAESSRPTMLVETSLPVRWYLPRDDVRTDLLRATNFTTECPFKGHASYWTLELGDQVHDGIVWSYETPIPAAEGVTGLMCFYNDRVDLTVDA